MSSGIQQGRQEQVPRPSQSQSQSQQQADDITVAVCCGCRPRASRGNRRRKYQVRKSWAPSDALRQIIQGPNAWRSNRVVINQNGVGGGGGQQNGFQDAELGKDSEWDRFSDADSMYFFDAEQQELDPNDYPADDYPIIFTNQIQHPAPHVSLKEPESLLRTNSAGVTFAEPPATTVHEGDHPQQHQKGAGVIHRSESAPYEPIESHRKRSERFQRITRRNTEEFKNQLESPRVATTLRGYPGDLSVEELAECQAFLRRLKTMDPGVSAQIYSMRDVEEEPYTICRWLRAMKFDHGKILDRCEENQPMYEVAQSNDFYPDVSKAIGAPFSIFLSQYPFLPIGRGKNGCPVNYFQVGKIHPEGIMALTTSQQLTGYFWWSFMHKFKEEIRKAQSRDPDFVRIEGINILDLEGLSASALSQETMDVIQLASKISDFFPETLHCMLILNAPSFFAMMWGVIKKFIDPRTAQRIQVFSSKSKGMAALQQLVSPEQIPTEYGGTNTSIKDAFKNEAHDPTLMRQEVQLVYVGRKKMTTDKIRWVLEEESEVMEISIYTRSVSSAQIVINMNGVAVATIPAARCLFGPINNNGDDDTNNPANDNSNSVDDANLVPKSNCITGETMVLLGPGLITVHVTDLDDAEKKHSSLSRGYFLVVGNVKRKETSMQ